MTSLHIEIAGNGPPLILLHGWGWHSAIWKPLLPQLTKKYQVFAVDLPGFGHSPILTKNYTFEEIIPKLLENMPDQAIWLGWSLGGLFANWVAIHFPERISHLITVATSPRFIADTHWPGIPISTLEKFSKLLVQDSQKTLTDFLELQLRGSPNQEKLFSTLSELLIHPPASLLGLMGGLELLRHTDFRTEMKTIRCPSLHIFGQRDTIVPANMADFANTLPTSQSEIIKHTGHMPFLTHPEVFLELLNKSKLMQNLNGEPRA